MTKYLTVMTSERYRLLAETDGAIEAAHTNLVENLRGVTPEWQSIAQRLAFDLPEFTWTIEVDVFGTHRITVHFKGARIEVDPTVKDAPF